MVSEIRNGFKNLARYAGIVEENPTKAALVLKKLREVGSFLGRNKLIIADPRPLIERKKRQEAQLRHGQWEDHLSAVAQEALHVENGEFVHSSANSVMRALKTKIADGSDPRLMSSFKDKTLANQVFTAGKNLSDVHRRTIFQIGEAPPPSDIKSFLASRFGEKVLGGWRQTLQYADKSLPEGTTVGDIVFLLLRFSEYSKLKSVQERVNAAKIS